jgi:hypothetical protein
MGSKILHLALNCLPKKTKTSENINPDNTVNSIYILLWIYEFHKNSKITWFWKP